MDANTVRLGKHQQSLLTSRRTVPDAKPGHARQFSISERRQNCLIHNRNPDTSAPKTMPHGDDPRRRRSGIRSRPRDGCRRWRRRHSHPQCAHKYKSMFIDMYVHHDQAHWA